MLGYHAAIDAAESRWFSSVFRCHNRVAAAILRPGLQDLTARRGYGGDHGQKRNLPLV
jgi:hypothetical protein